MKRIRTLRALLERVTSDRRDDRPCVRRGEDPSEEVHCCGGCGAAFVVSPGITVEPARIDGVAREFCACCHDFLGRRLAARNMALILGYDMEGQSINAAFPGLMPTSRRRHRNRETQARLEGIFRANATLRGALPPEPLFLAG